VSNTTGDFVKQQTIDVSNTTGFFREAADYMWVTRRESLEKQQTIDVSNTTGVFREAADDRCE
jgi:hypothetical protein